VKRWVRACLLVLALGAALPAVAIAQQPPPSTTAAQDEFVPMSEVPESEKLPAAPLVIGAYAFIWLAALAYLWSIWRRLGAVDREIAQLRRDVAGG
jgi:hypothetical protein